MFILIWTLLGSAIVAIILNGYWIFTKQDGHTNPDIGFINGILLVTFFVSLLVLGLTSIITGV